MGLGQNKVLFGIIIICIVIIGVFGVLYTNTASELEVNKEELTDVQARIALLNTSLQQNELARSKVENFTNTYFLAWSEYYQAEDVEDRAWFNYNKADGYYDEGNWFNAVGYFNEAQTYLWQARNAYTTARDAFYVVSNMSSNETLESVCLNYGGMMECMMRGMTYVAEAADRMEAACNYYLDGKYDQAHTAYDVANSKLGFYQEQLTLFDEYAETVKDLFITYS